MKFTDRLVLLHTGPLAPRPWSGPAADLSACLSWWLSRGFMWVDPSLEKIDAVFVNVRA